MSDEDERIKLRLKVTDLQRLRQEVVARVERGIPTTIGDVIGDAVSLYFSTRDAQNDSIREVISSHVQRLRNRKQTQDNREEEVE